jgi:hypothetical protein
LLTFPPKDEYSARSIAIGYLRYAAGDKDSPRFITPGIGGIPSHWCDCLPQDPLAMLSVSLNSFDKSNSSHNKDYAK